MSLARQLSAGAALACAARAARPTGARVASFLHAPPSAAGHRLVASAGSMPALTASTGLIGSPVRRLHSTPSTAADTPPATSEKLTFQAETKQLLHIVANSLYTDKHVFIRELVSNASDALEKARHRQVEGKPLTAPEAPLDIRITTDEAHTTVIFEDSGIGMAREELIENLGTIARSGSRAYLQKLREQQASGGAGDASGGAVTSPGSDDVASKIIGQFGVGFYSAFMVADHVTVYSRSAEPGSPVWRWHSLGDGSYEIGPVADGAPGSDVARGTRIVVKLKDSCREFCAPSTVKDILMRYSSFLSYPIALNGKTVNTVGAIWTKSGRGEVSEEEYAEFYKYKSGDFEPPLYRLHFASDAPIALKALLYVGSTHEEKYGMGRLRPGVDLYSRRVLIEPGSRIMPDWLRFVHGVVDSEDVPLNISRESMQDSALMKRLRSVLTRRVLRFLEAEARRDPATYASKFFPEFGNFLKEGAVSDATYAPEVARLLRFESSALPAGSLTSFDEYVSRMPPGQDAVYYLVAPHRGIAETSPYMEAFRGSGAGSAAAGGAGSGAGASGGSGGIEVLFLYSPLDDFVMNNLREFNGRKLTTVEMAELDPSKLTGLSNSASTAAGATSSSDDKKDAAASSADGQSEEGKAQAQAQVAPLTESQLSELGEWLRETLPGRISRVRSTMRLRSSPAVVTDHESAALRRMMRMVEQTAGRDSEGVRQEAYMLPAQVLEVNPAHPVIVRLHHLRSTQPALARVVAEQVFDNALVAAGLVDDSRTMLPRLNALLEMLVTAAASGSGAGAASAAAGAVALDPAATSSGYTSAADLAGRRFTSDIEREERRMLDATRAAVDETMSPDNLERIRKEAAERKAKKAAGDSAAAGTVVDSARGSGASKTSASPSAEPAMKAPNKSGDLELDALLAELSSTLKASGLDESVLREAAKEAADEVAAEQSKDTPPSAGRRRR